MSAATSCSSCGQLVDSAVEIRADDGFRATQGSERLRAQHVRSCPSLFVPDPLEHELEVRRLDPPLIALPGRKAATRVAEIDLSGRSLVEHVVDQGRLDLDRLAARLVVALDRRHDCLTRRGAIEVVEPKIVRKQVRNTPLEAIELCQGVVAERQQGTHAQSGAGHELGELARETGLLAVVEEVLLCLVEHEQQVAGKRLGPAAKGVCKRLALDLVEQRGTELVGQRVARSLAKRGYGVVAPLVVDDDDVLRMTAFLDVLPRVCS